MSDVMNRGDYPQEGNPPPESPPGSGPQGGYQPPPQPGPPPGGYPGRSPMAKNPNLAVGLSAICPGLGHLYVGYLQRGFIQMLGFAVAIAILSSNIPDGMSVLLGLFLPFWYFYGMVDAHRKAVFYNLQLAGGEVPDLPTDIKMPESGGSVLWGSALVGLGLLLLLNYNLDFSLEWLEDWWPLGLVILGASLIRRAKKSQGQDHPRIGQDQ